GDCHRGRCRGAVAGGGDRGRHERLQRPRPGRSAGMTTVAPRPASRAAKAPTRGGTDRRVAALTPLLADGLPPRGPVLRVPAAARAAFLAARRTRLPGTAPLVAVVRN